MASSCAVSASMRRSCGPGTISASVMRPSFLWPTSTRAFVGSRFDGVGETPFAHAPIACGPASRRVFEELVPIARSEIPVLVLGETGTGKELVAEAIHSASRRSGALRALNCAAIAPTLVESELFGFKKGAL